MSIELNELSINGLFSIKNQAEVLIFLEKNPEMVPVLRKSYDKIKEYFPESELTLDLIVDPDSPQIKQLVIWIDTDMSINEAISNQYQLDDAWIYNLPDAVLSKIIISLGSLKSR